MSMVHGRYSRLDIRVPSWVLPAMSHRLAQCVPRVPDVYQLFLRFWYTLNLLFSLSLLPMCTTCTTCTSFFQVRSAKKPFLFLVVKLNMNLKKGGTHGTHYLSI